MKLIFTSAVNVGLALALSPLLEGVIRKVTAVVQSRQGPPVLQPYFDLLKLLGKEDIESGVAPGMQRFAAALSLAAALAASLFVPMVASPPLSNTADVILLIYVLTLCGISTLLAGLAAGSTYSLLGISREMMVMMTLEPLLAIALVVGAVHTGSLRLPVVLDGSAWAAPVPLSGLLMLGVVIASFQAFVGRVPFDTAEAETEIMEGPLVEYSGPKLALFKYAQMIKLFVYGALFLSLFAPWGMGLFFPLNLAALLVKVLVLVLFVTLVAATHARYRIDQAIRFYALLFGVAVIALILAANGL